MIPYVSPKFAEEAFNCPHCNAFANQTFQIFFGRTTSHEYRYSICNHCRDIAIWTNGEMVYPLTSTAPLPNSDMPDDIKNDYKEASDIVNRSPRSACVLLRLCIEKICDEQNAKGRDLNEKIGDLVKRGLDESIQKALDAVRVIGGQAVHPLQMDLKDDIPTASSS